MPLKKINRYTKVPKYYLGLISSRLKIYQKLKHLDLEPIKSLNLDVLIFSCLEGFETEHDAREGRKGYDRVSLKTNWKNT